jgi:gliding motility-associated-like protein
MRKCLLFVALLVVSQFNILHAQSLFVAPDTVCVNQPVKLFSNAQGALSHYWGFCSGYLFNDPVGDNLTATDLNLDGPADIEIGKDGDNYYAFIANYSGSAHNFMRLNFGNSLNNKPTVSNFGNFEGALPENIGTMYLVKDTLKNNWHIFIGAGTDRENSSLARIDFGNSLANTPNIVNFGNLGDELSAPRGMFVAKEDDKWYGYFLNFEEDHILRIEFDTNISLTPTIVDLGIMPDKSTSGTIVDPTDMAALYDNGQWYFYVVNKANNWFTLVRLGSKLANAVPEGEFIRNPFGKMDNPSSISVARDCDYIHLFVTNRSSHQLLKYNLTAADQLITEPESYTNLGGILGPTGVTRVIRDKDELFLLVCNAGDNSLSRILFPQCTNASIQSSSSHRPPEYSYNEPGRYNIYYTTNEGMPNMQVQCKQIDVLPRPAMLISNDTTICQGDEISLTAYSRNALSYTWTPNYRITATDAIEVRVSPEYSTQYRIVLPFANGCIVDTGIDVTVRKIKADAGPDRVIGDGSTTLLGGPYTVKGPQYTYTWIPNQFLDNGYTANPTATPPHDFTYYLRVQDTSVCVAIDTVTVYIRCNQVVLPNAFVPGSTTSANSTFGIANSNLVKLNFFRIFDRWGKQVFETEDPASQWNGTVNGEPAPMGVYVWEADGFCASGQRVTSSGNVTLIR